ncbi:RNA ligase family protein [Nannocystaceae bacterium ST9]
MIRYIHVHQLHNVVRVAAERRQTGQGRPITRVNYRGTVKLHGSNASIVCTPAGLQPQSRNRELSVAEDNLGFAAFVAGAAQTEALRALERELRAGIGLADSRPLALFGEWIGPGVQKGVAVATLPSKQWVIFAVASRLDSVDAEGVAHREWFDAVPELGDRFASAGIHAVLDGPRHELELDFEDRGGLELAADRIERLTRAVDERCPWAARFGIEGPGEGLVWQPLGEHFGDEELTFKSKGEAHQVAARKGPRKAANVDPELIASTSEFIAHALTPARLAQGIEVLREQGKPLDMRSLGDYMRWLAGDVLRECNDELTASGIDWKQVVKSLNEQAKAYFRGRLLDLADAPTDVRVERSAAE